MKPFRNILPVLTVLLLCNLIMAQDSLNVRKVGQLSYNSKTHLACVAVSNGYTYVTSDSGLRVINVSNPLSSVEVKFVKDIWGYGIAAEGNNIYVVMCDSLLVFNTANPSLPALVGHCNTSMHPGLVVISGKLAYVSGNASV